MLFLTRTSGCCCTSLSCCMLECSSGDGCMVDDCFTDCSPGAVHSDMY